MDRLQGGKVTKRHQAIPYGQRQRRGELRGRFLLAKNPEESLPRQALSHRDERKKPGILPGFFISSRST
jgi:hypothetical protein